MLSLLSFAAPWLLVGLAALPVIWWLLRFIPPAPVRIVFPPVQLLFGLKSKEHTPQRSPWWLTALRILAAALIILALSKPLYHAGIAHIATGRPVLLVIDNGWAAANHWSVRQKLMETVIRGAENDGQSVYLLPTAGLSPASRLEPLSPDKARSLAASLEPLPVAPDRKQAAAIVGAALSDARGMNVFWLSDDLDSEGATDLQAMLEKAGSGGSLTIATGGLNEGPLGLYVKLGADHQLVARILASGGAARTGKVEALTARGERLADVPFSLAAGAGQTEVTIPLPAELQNQISRLEIAGEHSAGAVYLLDSRSLRHRVAILSGELENQAQPLLSPTHYIEKALSPFAELVKPHSTNIGEAADELLKQKPSVIVLADIGRLVDEVEDKLTRWVEAGGLLIRFAGARMEHGIDGLMPVQLREGGRTLGGALSWSTPQKLAAFEKTSPFFGLTIPDDISVSRQILADPAALGSPNDVWARLQDGTPLVTTAKLGKGRLVLYHVTGNPDWSNLPISGLFVDMLRRTLDQATMAVAPNSGETSKQETGKQDKARPEADAAAGEFLPPWKTLNGYGALGTPPTQAKTLSAAAFDKAQPSSETPPGYYGQSGQLRALNVQTDESRLSALPASGHKALNYTDDKSFFLQPWLFLAALALFSADAVITLIMMSGVRLRRDVQTAALIAAALLAGAISSFAPHPAFAGDKGDNKPPQTRTADADIAPSTIAAALQTRLAYVITGDDSIDRVSHAGLVGLSKVLAARTAVEPAEPMGVDIAHDELSVFPLLYWPVPKTAQPLSDAVLAKVDAYMKTGGMIVFDTRDYQAPVSGRPGSPEGPATPLGALLSKLDVPRLEPVSEEHVVTKSFYLLRGFPGRWDGGQLWVDAQTNISDTQTRRALKSDGVSPILVTSNDFAAAWALDEDNRPLFAVVPGGEEQREMAYRAGINIVMYALTGNYKADQVHVPTLLERLGH